MKKINHLDDKQIIEAVIGEGQLDEALRRHLMECSVCRAETEALQGRLARFGQISRSEVPTRFRKPSVFENNARAFTPRWKIYPALGVGLVVAILALFLSPLSIEKDKLYTPDMVYREMIQDKKFMAEIEKIEENPLPAFYVNITNPGGDKADTASPGHGVKNEHGHTLQGGSRNA